MQQFVLQHESGTYLGQDVAKGWMRTGDPAKALRLTCAKAQNVLKSNVRSEEQNQRKIIPETALAKSQTDPGVGDVDWNDFLVQTGDMYRKIEAYGKRLRQMHSEVDMEVCDLLHFIEFSSLSAAKGYEAYRMLRDALLRRRQIKDESYRAGAFLTGRPEDFLSGRIEKQLSGLDRREYAPRIRQDLFAG